MPSPVSTPVVILPDLGPIAPVSLTTPRLILRPFRPEDRAAFVDMVNVSEAFHSQFSSPPAQIASPEQEFEWALARAEKGRQAGTALRLAFFLHDDTTLAGTVGISDIVRGVSQRCNIGYRVSFPHLRRGYTFEAAHALLTYAFTSLSLHRVECGVQPDNLPSLALAAKLGFRQEGYAPRYLFFHNAWRDHVLFAKTAEEHISSTPPRVTILPTPV